MLGTRGETQRLAGLGLETLEPPTHPFRVEQLLRLIDAALVELASRVFGVGRVDARYRVSEAAHTSCSPPTCPSRSSVLSSRKRGWSLSRAHSKAADSWLVRTAPAWWRRSNAQRRKVRP